MGYLKTSLPVFLIYTTLYSYFYQKNLDDFFRTYLDVGLAIASFGLLQVFIKFTTGIGLLSPYSSLDLHSIVTEPSHYVVVILPALVYSFFYYKKYKFHFWLFLATLMLTFKLTAFVSLLIIFVLARFKLIYILFSVPFVYVGYHYLMSIPEYVLRITPIANILGADLEKVVVLHGTPLSFLSNLEVAFDSATRNLFFGGGLGSHPYSYDRYFTSNPWIGVESQFGLNQNSGHSILIRLLSEVGYTGLCLILGMMIKIFREVRSSHVNKVIFFAALSHFVAKSIKLGGYIDFGTPVFFCILLVLLGKKQKKLIKLS
ncbi:MAG: hypothetical protein ACON5K_04200 [Bacteroidia bacterium]